MQSCAWCDEPIIKERVDVPHIDAETVSHRRYHRECFLRQVLGSVGHQRRRCSCYGGDEEDPVGMTRREAARAAAREAELSD